jgi:hypothetical protein
MAHTETNTDRLNWDVYVTPATPIVTRDKPPRVRDTFGQAIASTLIHGVRRPGGCVPDGQPGQRSSRLGCCTRDEPDDNLHHTWPRRPLVWSRHSP